MNFNKLELSLLYNIERSYEFEKSVSIFLNMLFLSLVAICEK